MSQSGIIGSRRQSPFEFQRGEFPLKVEVSWPSGDLKLEKVEAEVRQAFGMLPAAPYASLLLITKLLVANAEQHARPEPGLLIGATTPVLTLGWARDETTGDLFPFVAVSDRNKDIPRATGDVHSGLIRVMALSSQCGFHDTTTGKQVWAVVDPQVW